MCWDFQSNAQKHLCFLNCRYMGMWTQCLSAGSLVRLKGRGQEANTVRELKISGIHTLLAAGMCVEDFMRVRDC
jgi:hypothetical protein